MVGGQWRNWLASARRGPWNSGKGEKREFDLNYRKDRTGRGITGKSTHGNKCAVFVGVSRNEPKRTVRKKDRCRFVYLSIQG
jgi:hypothetical protein